MSLNDIQLSPFLVQQLYTHSLVNLAGDQLITNTLQKNEFSFLGNNRKKILLIVNEPAFTYLAEEELEFLMGILTACKLSMQDIALFNFGKQPGANYKDLMKEFNPETILLFGIEPALLQFPLQFPLYQLQKYNSQTCLYAPSLKQLAADKQMKLQLWTSLKTLFLN